MTANFRGATTRIANLESELKTQKNDFEAIKRQLTKKSEADDSIIEGLRQEKKRMTFDLEREKVDKKFNIAKPDSRPPTTCTGELDKAS